MSVAANAAGRAELVMDIETWRDLVLHHMSGSDPNALSRPSLADSAISVYCPLTEGADLMIYEPLVAAYDDAGLPHLLAAESAVAHPDVPMLLAWPPATPPDAGTLRAIHAEAPWFTSRRANPPRGASKSKTFSRKPRLRPELCVYARGRYHQPFRVVRR
jgi:hypothetical protein